MSDAKTQSKKQVPRRQRSIYQVHYNISRRQDSTRAMAWPLAPLQKYGRQVAGHSATSDDKYLGLLQCNNGTILKPIIKPSQRREIDFYSRISSSSDPDLVELRGSVPKYFGSTHHTYQGTTQEYIVMEDVCNRMLEPSIMDVKIGKRTWDPLASEEKQKREEQKYAQCKKQYGFCIPGFQVYRLSTGQLCRYNKDYGKRLHSEAVVDALRKYLNGAGAALRRPLVLQLLAALWRVQRWARRQRRVRLCGASLLLAYDTAQLRACCQPATSPVSSGAARLTPRPRRRSVHSVHSVEGSSFSGQLSAKGPVYKKLSSVPLTSLTIAQTAFSPPPPVSSPWTEALDRLAHNHSFEHNYEDTVSKMKMNYKTMLDQLSNDAPVNSWATVKIIDFAHAFFNEEEEMEVDENFKEGIDNFVEIFERFLKETDDQVDCMCGVL